MVIVNSQKSLRVEIIENINLRILNVILSINIYIIESIKKKLLIRLNWLVEYKANLILNENKLKF